MIDCNVFVIGGGKAPLCISPAVFKWFCYSCHSGSTVHVCTSPDCEWIWMCCIITELVTTICAVYSSTRIRKLIYLHFMITFQDISFMEYWLKKVFCYSRGILNCTITGSPFTNCYLLSLHLWPLPPALTLPASDKLAL